MPVKVNGVENNVQTAPVQVPENSQAAPQEQPMTPVTPQGASSDAAQPQQPATEAAPVTPAAPAAATNNNS
jgi:L,D-transpeptidase YbiS